MSLFMPTNLYKYHCCIEDLYHSHPILSKLSLPSLQCVTYIMYVYVHATIHI